MQPLHPQVRSLPYFLPAFGADEVIAAEEDRHPAVAIVGWIRGDQEVARDGGAAMGAEAQRGHRLIRYASVLPVGGPLCSLLPTRTTRSFR